MEDLDLLVLTVILESPVPTTEDLSNEEYLHVRCKEENENERDHRYERAKHRLSVTRKSLASRSDIDRQNRDLPISFRNDTVDP